MPALRVVITGGASGLGRELALAYARRGAKVAIADLQQQRGAATVADIQASGGEGLFIALDVRNMAQFETLRDELNARWHGVDIVINNAGVASGGSFEQVSLDTWEWMLSINLMGVVKGCRAFTPLFKAQRHGHFVNIASMAGLLCPPDMAEYNVAKAGVIALSETLRAELSPYNIFTTVVCPSFFKTNLAESFRGTDALSAKTLEKLLETSDISATDIAEQIYNAVAARQFMLLPHEKARAMYALKQTDPERVFAEMVKVAQSNYSKRVE